MKTDANPKCIYRLTQLIDNGTGYQNIPTYRYRWNKDRY